MRRVVPGLLLLAGLAAFGWFVVQAQPGRLLAELRQVGWAAGVIFLPYLAVYAADTRGWQMTLVPRPSAGFPALFRVRWAGEALNNVMPSAYVGGEALKAWLLQRHGVSMVVSAPAALVSKTIQTLAQLVFLAAAAAAFLSLGTAPPVFRWVLLLVLAGGLAGAAGLLALQWRGFFRTITGVARRLGIRSRRLEARAAELHRFDAAVGTFYRNERARFRASFLWYLTGWLLDTTEILLVARLFGVPLSWPQALAIEALTGVVKVANVVIPGALGVQESGIVLLCRLAGAPVDFGMSYALLRRAREVLFVAVGWGWLWGERWAGGGDPTPVSGPTRP